jgi:O-succinylbenzoic acid--CoA ligase
VTAEPSRPPARPVRPVEATAAAVPDLLGALREALSGAGPALLPVAAGEAAPVGVAPGSPGLPGLPEEADPTALAVPTSGSGGARKVALLPASALLASAAATHDRLGGPGRWLLALPPQHVAGLQVLVRSLVAGTTPVVLDLAGGFSAAGFAAAARRVTGVRRYTSLVPTQLTRLLSAGGEAAEALAGFDAVLVGGAATPRPLAERARAAGVRLVTTYGMTETCGGCVYDGLPLDGVLVRTGGPGQEGRIHVGGPVVARGYLGGPAITAGPDGVRWHLTDDLGTWDGTRLTVAGRADDVVVTGGHNVAPRPVEEALLRLPGVAEAVVVGVPDDEWGHAVAAAVVLEAGASAPTLAAVREHVAAAVAPQAAPRRLVVVPALPLRGPGKPDRAAVAALLDRVPDHRTQEGTA